MRLVDTRVGSLPKRTPPTWATPAVGSCGPVTFRDKQPYADGEKPIQYGLIAEEVASVYPDLVARSADGQLETVKYPVLDSLLLNEVQRQQAEISSEQDRIGTLEQQNRDLLDRMRRLEAAISVKSR